MNEYICKIATIEEMEQNWNYLVEIHPNNNAWKIYKEEIDRWYSFVRNK